MKLNQKGIAHLGILAVAVVAVVGAATIFVVRNQDTKPTTNSQTTETEQSDLSQPLPNDLLTAEKVKELAQADAKDTSLTSVELENEHGTYLYKVKLANGKILFFDAKTGAKVTHDAGEVESEDGEIPAGFVAKISYDQAREIALKQKPGGTISKIELESEEGKVVYSVKFSDKARVDVDATTGEVVRTKAAEAEKKTDTSKTTPSSSTSQQQSSSKPTSSSSSNDDHSTDTSHDENDDSSDDDDDDDSSHGGNSGSNKDKSN